jgi:hypothetical protein
MTYEQTTLAMTTMIAALKATSSTVVLSQPTEVGYVPAQEFVAAKRKWARRSTGRGPSPPAPSRSVVAGRSNLAHK